MNLDLAVAALLLISGGLGMWTGAVKQLAHFGGLLAGFLCARPLAALLAPYVAHHFGYPVLITAVGLSFPLFFLVYLAAVLVVRVLLERLIPEQGELNRTGGLVLGLAKAAVIAYVVLCGMALFEKPLGQLVPALRPEMRKSYAYGAARKFNLLARLPPIEGLERLIEKAKSAPAELSEEGQLLANDVRVQALLEDPDVRRAVKAGDHGSLLVHPKVRALLEDARVRERLTSLASE